MSHHVDRIYPGRLVMPAKPYAIYVEDWEWFYEVQQSGEMNMLAHPLVSLFMPDGAYDAAFKHFVEEGRRVPVVIE